MTTKTRNIVLVGMLGGLLIAIILTVSQLQKQQDIRQRASQQDAAHLSLVPATMQKSPNDEFDVQVFLDVGRQVGITGIELTIQFDRTKVQLLNRFSPTNAFSTVVNEPRSPTPFTDQLTFTGTASPDNLVSSSVLIGTARFKAVGGGTASITFPRVNITKLNTTGFIQVGTHDTASITIAGPTVPPAPTNTPSPTAPPPPPATPTFPPPPTPGPLGAPSGLRASCENTLRMRFEWNDTQGAEAYAIRVDDITSTEPWNETSPAAGDTVKNDINKFTPYFQRNGEAGHEYRWWVHAVDNQQRLGALARGTNVTCPGPAPTATPTGVPPSPTPTPTPGPTATPTTFHPADFNRSRCIDREDFNVWVQAFTTGIIPHGTFPDVAAPSGADLLDFNVWYKAMLERPELRCQGS